MMLVCVCVCVCLVIKNSGVELLPEPRHMKVGAGKFPTT